MAKYMNKTADDFTDEQLIRVNVIENLANDFLMDLLGFPPGTPEYEHNLLVFEKLGRDNCMDIDSIYSIAEVAANMLTSKGFKVYFPTHHSEVSCLTGATEEYITDEWEEE